MGILGFVVLLSTLHGDIMMLKRIDVLNLRPVYLGRIHTLWAIVLSLIVAMGCFVEVGLLNHVTAQYSQEHQHRSTASMIYDANYLCE